MDVYPVWYVCLSICIDYDSSILICLRFTSSLRSEMVIPTYMHPVKPPGTLCVSHSTLDPLANDASCCILSVDLFYNFKNHKVDKFR